MLSCCSWHWPTLSGLYFAIPTANLDYNLLHKATARSLDKSLLAAKNWRCTRRHTWVCTYHRRLDWPQCTRTHNYGDLGDRKQLNKRNRKRKVADGACRTLPNWRTHRL